MSILTLITIATTLLFGMTTVWLSILEEKTKKQLTQEEETHRQRIYEATLLKDIQDKIGYSLDTERVMDVITGSLRNMFSYSIATSLIVSDEKMLLKYFVEERVSHKFFDQVKQAVLASYTTITNKPIAVPIEEIVSGVALDDTNPFSLHSFFHIPLIVNDKVLGIITVSSFEPNRYEEDEMTLLYQIVDQANHALSRLQTVLTQEKGKLTAMIRSLSDGLFMVDIDNKLTLINEAAKHFLHIEKPSPSILDVMAALPNTLDFSTKMKQAIEERKTVTSDEMMLFERTIQVYITPVINFNQSIQKEHQEVIGVSVLLHDITLEKNLNQLKDDFTTMVVHNLRAPLNSVKGASQLLLESEEKLSEPEKEKLLHIIDEQARKLLDDVASILDASRLESGRFAVNKTEGSLEETIADRVTVFHPMAQNKHVTLVGQVEHNLPKLAFDQRYIGQAINNLISNALKFTPAGGRITVSAKKTSDNTITVSVSDTGVGIPKEQQGRLFSRFAQLSNIPQPNGTGLLTTGTGLGLYIVKGIVEAHGGKISLESETGMGTTISFTLPLIQPQTTQASPSQPVPPVSLLGQTVN